MEENIYLLPDGEIRRLVGQKIRYLRLRQDLTQASLAEQAQVSLTTLKKIETGDISYFDSLMRVLRVLGELEVFSPLIKEEEMSPNEYFKFVEANRKKQRKRASGNNTINPCIAFGGDAIFFTRWYASSTSEATLFIPAMTRTFSGP